MTIIRSRPLPERRYEISNGLKLDKETAWWARWYYRSLRRAGVGRWLTREAVWTLLKVGGMHGGIEFVPYGDFTYETEPE